MSLYADHPVVLVGGSYNALSAARSLGRSGCSVHLALDVAGGGFVAASRYVTSTFQPTSASSPAEEWLDWLLERGPRDAVVIPCSDAALELLAGARPALSAAGLHPAEADDDLVLAMLDKQVTYEAAGALGFRVPRTCVVTGIEQGLAAAQDFALPFALKPRVSHRFLRDKDAAPKGVVVHRREALGPALEMIVRRGLSVLLTEIVPGADDEYCSYYGYVDAEGRQLVHFTKRKLRQYPVGFGSGTYHVTGSAPDVAVLGAELFAALGLRGLGNVEFKRDERDGGLVLIECNLRLTAATELVRRAGVDLTDLVYRRALGLRVEPVTAWRDDLRQWLPLRDLRAFRDYRRAGAMTTRHYVRTLAHRQTVPVLDVADLGPSRSAAVDLVRRSMPGARPARSGVEPGVSGIASRLLATALRRSHGGPLGRVALSEAGILAGAGPHHYARRWAAVRVSRGGDTPRAALYRRYWSEAATWVGADLEDLGEGLLRVSRGDLCTVVWDAAVRLDDPLVLRVAGDKAASAALLRAAGLPVSDGVDCGPHDVERALELLGRARRVVVKPSHGGGGNGVTCGVVTSGELVAAFAAALRYSSRVRVERQVAGAEYRLLVLGGVVVSTVRRRPPTVVGDGRSTVEELVRQTNARRRADAAGAGLYPIGVDLDLVLTLRRTGRTLRSVPGRGETVTVQTAVNHNGPGDNELVVAPPRLAQAAVDAAHALGAELAAVEVITKDPSRSLHDVGGTVVEVNTTPGLHYHYQVRNPAPGRPVAAVLLEHLLQRSEGAAVEAMGPARRLHVG